MENGSVEHFKRKFNDFLNEDGHDGKYLERIRQSIVEKKRFILNINDVRAHENDWAVGLIRRPRVQMIALQESIMEIGKNIPEVRFCFVT
jgi:DNA replicative helicase MCM subunit Mcm2 (Cdc46/Mcm family)